MSDRNSISRDILPVPDAQYVGLTTYDAKDPDNEISADRGAAPSEGCPQRADRPG
jgi:hypothetical protein